ncbi:MAG: hypothetical protein ACFFCZ_22070 [Promethearchaeota archaeon]
MGLIEICFPTYPMSPTLSEQFLPTKGGRKFTSFFGVDFQSTKDFRRTLSHADTQVASRSSINRHARPEARKYSSTDYYWSQRATKGLATGHLPSPLVKATFHLNS